jgi:hypothetical protein
MTMSTAASSFEPTRYLLRLWEERYGVLPVAYRRQFVADPIAEAITRFPLYRVCVALDRFGPKLRLVLLALQLKTDAVDPILSRVPDTSRSDE